MKGEIHIFKSKAVCRLRKLILQPFADDFWRFFFPNFHSILQSLLKNVNIVPNYIQQQLFCEPGLQGTFPKSKLRLSSSTAKPALNKFTNDEQIPIEKYTCKLRVNFWNWILFMLVENDNMSINSVDPAGQGNVLYEFKSVVGRSWLGLCLSKGWRLVPSVTTVSSLVNFISTNHHGSLGPLPTNMALDHLFKKPVPQRQTSGPPV